MGTLQWEIYFYQGHPYSNLYLYIDTHTFSCTFCASQVGQHQQLLSILNFLLLSSYSKAFFFSSPNGPASYSHRLFTCPQTNQLSVSNCSTEQSLSLVTRPITTITITDVLPLPVSYMMSVLTYSLICIMLSSYNALIMTSSLQ